jgi:uncharacterized delta-60 repeat protein
MVAELRMAGLAALFGVLSLCGPIQGRTQESQCSIDFVSAQFCVSENTRTLTLSLRLVGPCGPTVPRVDFATQDGTAASGLDYVARSGQVTAIYGFEQPLEIFVILEVLDDTLVEGEETFRVVLSNPSGGAKLGSNHTAVVTIVDNDTVSDAGRGANDVVRAGAMDPDGRTVIAGDFTSVDGIRRNGIARLKVDGSLDVTFDPGSAAYRQVETLAIQGDGKVLVGGGFTNFSGVPRMGLARLNVDGSLDAGFLPRFRLTNAPAGGSVTRMVIDPDGRLLVGGYYNEVNGTARRGIARLHPDGSLDETFEPNLFVVSTVDPIALQPDGRLLVNATVRDGLNEIFRLTTNGTWDWFQVPFVTAVAYEIIALPSGKTIMGGYFGGLGGGGIGIYGFEVDGALDPAFNPARATFGAAGVGGIGRGINAMALQSDGKLLVGGGFHSIGGTARVGIARLQEDGLPDPSFTPSLDTDAVVTGVFAQPGGGILIIGSFSNVNQQNRYRIARLRPDGSLIDALQFEPPARLEDGRIRLTLRVLPPQKCLIQASGDLRAWTDLWTNVEPKTRFEFVDENLQGLQRRFYRALTLP